MADRRIRTFCFSLSGSSLRNGGNRRRFFFSPVGSCDDFGSHTRRVLIPLIAVLISYDAFVGEREHGTLILLLTYPLSRTALLTGKLLGQGVALGVCLLLGFSVLPLLTALNVLPYDLTRLSLLTAALIFSGWLLGLVFILISLTVSLLAKNKARTLGVLLSIWLLSVIFTI